MHLKMSSGKWRPQCVKSYTDYLVSIVTCLHGDGSVYASVWNLLFGRTWIVKRPWTLCFYWNCVFLFLLKPEYCEIISSIPLLLMPWLFAATIYSTRESFKYLCHLSHGDEKWQTMEIYLLSFLEWIRYERNIHWNQKVVILTTFSALAAPEVVIRTTSGATSDEKVVNMTTFCFQFMLILDEHHTEDAMVGWILGTKKHTFSLKNKHGDLIYHGNKSYRIFLVWPVLGRSNSLSWE